MCEGVCSTHQPVGVIAHVPEGDEGQGDPAAVLGGDLVLTGHHRRDGPPANGEREREGGRESQRETEGESRVINTVHIYI